MGYSRTTIHDLAWKKILAGSDIYHYIGWYISYLSLSVAAMRPAIVKLQSYLYI